MQEIQKIPLSAENDSAARMAAIMLGEDSATRGNVVDADLGPEQSLADIRKATALVAAHHLDGADPDWINKEEVTVALFDWQTNTLTRVGSEVDEDGNGVIWITEEMAGNTEPYWAAPKGSDNQRWEEFDIVSGELLQGPPLTGLAQAEWGMTLGRSRPIRDGLYSWAKRMDDSSLVKDRSYVLDWLAKETGVDAIDVLTAHQQKDNREVEDIEKQHDAALAIRGMIDVIGGKFIDYGAWREPDENTFDGTIDELHHKLLLYDVQTGSFTELRGFMDAKGQGGYYAVQDLTPIRNQSAFQYKRRSEPGYRRSISTIDLKTGTIMDLQTGTERSGRMMLPASDIEPDAIKNWNTIIARSIPIDNAALDVCTAMHFSEYAMRQGSDEFEAFVDAAQEKERLRLEQEWDGSGTA
jgi:hypothetical protein